MTTEPATQDGRGDQSVTPAEFAAAMGAIKQDFDGVRDELKELRGEIASIEDRMATKVDLAKLIGEIASMKDEIVRHFNVVAENIHQDVASANADRVSLLENHRADHEERITAVEQRLGFRP